MTFTLLLLAGLGLVAWAAARAKALAVAGGGARAHSLPAYDGWYVALWALLPALLFLLLWSVASPALIADAATGAAGLVTVDATGVGPARVAGDEGLLAQVVRNVVDNAARHARGAIAFTLRSDGAGVLLAVEDDGPGIPPGDRERVFERFVRLEPGRAREAGGTGLGLAISASVVGLHGGTISTGETDEGWCRFSVTLPAAP